MISPPVVPRTVSPIDAALQAIDHVKRHLFPFRFERWLTLGFVAFLDQCGRGGPGIPNLGGRAGDQGSRGGPRADEVSAWIGEHLLLIVLIAAGVLVLVVALTALMLWINSRGVFIYIDDVATGRADVARPWREHAARASSYFAWSFGLSLATLSLVLLVLVPLLLAIFTLAREGVRAWTIVVLVACILVLLALMILASLASLALRDFVAPIQLCAGVSCGEALGLFLPLLRMQPGAFALYVLLKICFAVALGITLVVVGCATCCCGFLPVVAQTLLQPALYFERAWPLHMLRAVGYDVMQENP